MAVLEELAVAHRNFQPVAEPAIDGSTTRNIAAVHLIVTAQQQTGLAGPRGAIRSPGARLARVSNLAGRAEAWQPTGLAEVA